MPAGSTNPIGEPRLGVRGVPATTLPAGREHPPKVESASCFRPWATISAEPLAEPSTAERKLAAKRFNERLKLFANTITAIGLSVFATATIIPNFGQPSPGATASVHPWWTGPSAFSILFCVALTIYRFLPSEE